MVRDLLSGPAQKVLTASVARRYYVDGKSKIEIANTHMLSPRAQPARRRRGTMTPLGAAESSKVAVVEARAAKWRAVAMCQHQPPCPSPDAPGHATARVIASHPEQGWSLLCNGVVLFDDTGELLPTRQAVQPHRPVGASRALLAAAA
jgi:hypothetical protein